MINVCSNQTFSSFSKFLLFSKESVNLKSTTLGYQESAPSGRIPGPACNGRPCPKCGRCRDWCYTGDLASWQWLRNAANWNSEDWSRWGSGAYWKNFKLRRHATCTSHHGLIDRAIDFGYHPFAPAVGGPAFCMCEDNIQI